MDKRCSRHAAAAGSNVLTLAHVSDPHLARLEDATPAQLLNKRILGYFKWRLQRHGKHDPSIADALVRDIHETDPCHTVITGDITHLGLPAEFRNARRWLERLGCAEKISITPGNHDSYVRTRFSQTFALWLEYMKSDLNFMDESACAGEISSHQSLFPTIRLLGSTALIGLSSSTPSPLHVATGKIGNEQLERLERLFLTLEEMERKRGKLFRIVCLHHPPLEGLVSHRKRLVDGGKLIHILKKHGCHLILHGHAHRHTEAALETSIAKAPVIGAPSATSTEPDAARRSAWFLYCIHVEGKKRDRFSLAVKKRMYHLEKKSFSWAEEADAGGLEPAC